MTDTCEDTILDYSSLIARKVFNKTDAITFTFYTEELLLRVKTELLNQYNFEVNKN